MNRKIVCIVLMGLVCGAVFAESVKVSFDFQRMKGYATNQFAVWVENSQGKLVKTLYVTKFTAQKGFNTRPDSLPLWVSKAAPSSSAKMDASSGATPKSGSCSYVWNITDSAGKTVEPGVYTVCFEATQFWEKRIIAKCDVEVGSDGSVTVQEPVLTQIPAKETDHDINSEMISAVKVETIR